MPNIHSQGYIDIEINTNYNVNPYFRASSGERNRKRWDFNN